MENNKSNKILGIISIIWGALVLIYEILKNTVLDFVSVSSLISVA